MLKPLETDFSLNIQHIVMSEGIDEHRSIRYHVSDKMGALSVYG